MIYKSIQVEIEALVQGGRLKLLEPMLPGRPILRPIFTTAEFYQELSEAVADKGRGYRVGHLFRDLDRFIAGDHVTIGHGEEKYCDLKPLLPEQQEVWTIRSRAPKPALRVFGRFARTDMFIATNMQERRVLDHKRSRFWAIEITRCKAEWSKLFPDRQPHSGENFHEYISTNVTEFADN